MREDTISINGVLYDAKTGQPVKKPAPAKPAVKSAPHATSKGSAGQAKKVNVRQPKKITVKTTATSKGSAGHAAPKPAKRKPAPSRTLNRQVVKKPVATSKKSAGQTAAKKTAPTPKPKAMPAPSHKPIPPRIVYRGVKRPKTASAAKHNPVTTRKRDGEGPAKAGKKTKFISIIISICVLVAIGGTVAAYFFVPQFSVWVAAQRADVRAVLPVYTPTGYKVSGTAESSLGLVTINYHSDTQNNSYSLTQANSNWDSIGVLENKVKPLGGSHQTLSQKGLTIYRYSTGAIWVNGGVLYTITDEGKLSNEQILQIVDGI